MADLFTGRPFAMLMMKPFVPKRLQPWIYILFAVVFQLINGVYLGSVGQMVGSTGLMRTDIMMVFLFGVVGVSMPFPILFRLKFAFPNRRLMLVATVGMLVCNVVPMITTNIVALCIFSYLCGYFKLMGTFECMSNVQLWITPKRDFQVFFPLLYMIVLGDMSLSGWTAAQLTYYCGTWQAMHLLVIGLLLLILLFLYTCTQNFMFMRPLPFISIDWLGCILWSSFLLQGIWLFNYGEYFNWWDSPTWRSVLLTMPLTLAIAVWRMCNIRHPYIDPKAFKYKTLIPILFMFAVAEIMNSMPNVLENAFTGSILHYGPMTATRFKVITIVANLTGCAFCLLWYKVLEQKYTRLLTVGFACLLIYQTMMYFYISPDLNIETLYLPTFIRAFGYTLFFVTLTLYLQELMPFQHFFMGLTIAGFIRNGMVESITDGVYGYLLRYHVADSLMRGLDYNGLDGLSIALKQLFGITCIGGSAFLILLMLWHVQPVRSTLKHIPYWNVIGRQMRKELEANKHHE